MANPGDVREDGLVWYAGAWRTPLSIVKRRERDLIAKKRIGKPSRLRHRVAILEMFGNKCAHCGYTDWRALEIDHIHGGGTKHRKTFSSPTMYYKHILSVAGEGFQLLCSNCNTIKKYENKE